MRGSDLLSDIRKLQRQIVLEELTPSVPADDPVRYWERAWAEVMTVIKKCCSENILSYDVLLARLERTNPSIVDKYYELCDIIDHEVNGKLLDGTLADEDLQSFYRNVDEWRSATIRMLAILSNP